MPERNRMSLHRISRSQLPTKFGHFEISVYEVRDDEVRDDRQQPIVFTMGDLQSSESALVRIHSSCFTGDLAGSLRCDCGDQLQLALQMIANEGVGVLVYLQQEGRGIGLAEKIKAYNLQDQGMDTVEANLALGHEPDARDYTIGIQILADLGLTNIRLLTNNPKKLAAFDEAETPVQVVERIPIAIVANAHNVDYLATKRDKMGHVLP
ncbi:UNVERIFIED_CONTAM: hypothetical protein GTU68_058911 [Idotea baltica]|nr:hypothetical protein [Idotea baltica]